MDAIYIPHLTTLPDRTEKVEFKEFLSALETLTPVQGELTVKHCGNYLEVAANANAIVTLICHRCLQQYNHRLAVALAEVLWLQDEVEDVIPCDRDLELDDLLESLSPTGNFDPGTWLYEQLCLALPLRQLCDQQCAGIPLPASETQAIDHRWAALANLKNQLPSSNGEG
jgi:uncharacterized protein